jgi:Family of unknown function (DUF6113)
MSGSDRRAVVVGAYLALFLLGLLLGLIGSFQYSRGPAPLAAILFDAGILVTCVLGSWGMRTALGGVLPAAGWFLVTLVLSSVPAGGSVVITNTSAGKWFLFGGAVCAAAGAVYAFAKWSRPSRDRRTQPADRSRPAGGPRSGAASRPVRRSGR